MATSTGDTIGDAEINNNVQCRVPCQGATLPTNGSASITEQGSGVEHTQAKPRVISNGDDDDEAVIFREDNDDDDEGYIFADQYDETDEDIEIDGTQDESTASGVVSSFLKVLTDQENQLKLDA